jgi:hypothetical protein
MSETDLCAVLLASLLHDVGQYPLAHDVEEADPSMPSHEEMGRDLLKDDKTGLRTLVENEWEVTLARVLEILEAKPKNLIGDLRARILHSLIDGPIDADKIDYLMRDSRRLGLTYGAIIDLERLLRCLTIVFRGQDEETFEALGIHEKGKVTADAVAFARYAMYGQVYWHHTYRAFKIMFHRLIWDALNCAPDDRARTQFRKDFRKFVSSRASRPTGGTTSQGFLFLDEAVSVDGEEVAAVNSNDRAVLRWLGERSGTCGSVIGKMIEQRRLFKRILVLSRERMRDRDLWDRLSDFISAHNRSWKKKGALQESLQDRIVTLGEQPREPNVQRAIITDDNRSRFLSEAQTEVVVLVDIPPESPAGDAILEFLVEEDRRRYKVDEVKTGTLEHSVVWRELRKNFRQSIGKMRVFAHPDHNDFLSAYLSRSDIEGALDGALRKVDGE